MIEEITNLMRSNSRSISVPRYTQGQELMVISPKTRRPYKVRVMGTKLASGQHVEGGTDWYYILREVGSRHRLLRGGFLASESTLDTLICEKENE